VKKSNKNAQKFIHELNKQQIELWRHPANLSELFLAENFDGDSFEDR